MRISDWSSDVCSSDLPGEGLLPSLNGTSPPLTSLACGRGIFGDYSVTKAAILIEPGKPLVIEEVVVDKPGPHEVRIRTVACGLCHSDLHFIDGVYPHPARKSVVLGKTVSVR